MIHQTNENIVFADSRCFATLLKWWQQILNRSIIFSPDGQVTVQSYKMQCWINDGISGDLFQEVSSIACQSYSSTPCRYSDYCIFSSALKEKPASEKSCKTWCNIAIGKFLHLTIRTPRYLESSKEWTKTRKWFQRFTCCFPHSAVPERRIPRHHVGSWNFAPQSMAQPAANLGVYVAVSSAAAVSCTRSKHRPCAARTASRNPRSKP